MIVLKAVLVSRDKDYIRAWLDYIQGHSSSFHMRFTAFSQWEAFRSYMDEQTEREVPDVIIAEPEFLNPWLMNGGRESGVPWLMLIEGSEEGSEINRLMKYQPLPVLLEAVRNACRQPRTKRNRRPGQETLTVGLLSASGGSGKTAAALHMAKQLGLAGYAVLYLNLETLDSSLPFLESGLGQGSQPPGEAETGLSRLLYELKAHKREMANGQVQMKHPEPEHSSTPGKGGKIKGPGEYVISHEALKSDIFWPLANRSEMLQMSKADTVSLIRYLSDCGHYEVVIVDGDSGWNGRSEGIMEAADSFVWLIEDDIAAMHRWGQWLQHAERTHPDMLAGMLERTYFVINKHREQVLNTLPRADLQVDAVLPYIPSWKQLNQAEVMLSSPIFQREVKKLCALLFQAEGEERRQTGQTPQRGSWVL